MHKLCWLFALLLLGVTWLGSAVVYERLPEQIPIHWNIEGEVDNTGPKQWAAFIMPCIMLVLVGFFWLIPWLSPRPFEVDSFRTTYLLVMVIVVALLGYIHLLSLAVALGRPVDMNRALLGGLFLFFAAIGALLGRVQRNFWIGVRTPWTLANEQVWDDTHRVAGRIFMSIGLLGLVGVVLGLPAGAAIALLIVAALVPVVYSLVRYKQLERS